MGNKKVTHARVYVEDVMDFQKEMPGIPTKDVIKTAWNQYKSLQKAGRFIYGSFWNSPKKK